MVNADAVETDAATETTIHHMKAVRRSDISLTIEVKINYSKAAFLKLSEK